MLDSMNYIEISKVVIEILKERVAATSQKDFVNLMREKTNIEKTSATRLFKGIVDALMINDDHGVYTFSSEIKNQLDAKLSSDRIELICLKHRVFQKRGRHAADAENKLQKQIEIVAERCKATKGQADDPMKTLIENLYFDLEKIDASITASALEIKNVEDKLNAMKCTHQKLVDERKSIEKSIHSKEKLMNICKTMKISVEELKSLL